MRIQSPLSNLREALAEVKEAAAIYKTSLLSKEDATRAVLVDPLLRALGWNIGNPHIVEVEKTLSGSNSSRVDYALYDVNHLIVAIVEAKPLGQSLNSHAQQLVQYAYAFGVTSLFLTNGLVWHHYTNFSPQNFVPTRTFDLASDDLVEVAAFLVQKLDAANFWPDQPDVDVLAQEVDQLRSDLSTLQQYVADLKKVVTPTSLPHDFWASSEQLALMSNLREILLAEGGSVSLAEDADKFYVVTNESAMADFLDEEDQGFAGVHVTEFDTEGKRTAYLEKRGWAKALQEHQWVALTNIKNATHTRPSALRLPDNSEPKVKYWKDVLVETCKFVLAHEKNLPIPLVDRSELSVNLIDTDPPAKGISFISTEYNGQTVYIHTNYSAENHIANALYICQKLTGSYSGAKPAVIYKPSASTNQ